MENQTKQLTGQEIFSRVWEHSRGMTERAFNYKTSACVYLTPTGNKCFIGALIPHGHPAQKYDRFVLDLVEQYPDLPFVDWVREDWYRAKALQDIHDIYFAQREAKLLEFALTYGYEVPGE